MPEAPEVAYLVDYINDHFKGNHLHSVTIMKGRYYKHGPPSSFHAFCSALPLKLMEVTQKGKVLIMRFQNGWYIISRLGLTGWWYEDGDPPQWMRSSPNLQFDFQRVMGSTNTLMYIDILSYGTLTFTNDRNVVDTQLSKLAPHVETISVQELTERLENKPHIKYKLLEDVIIDQQALISGVGNYLKAEILYDAGISPLRQVSSISYKDWAKILHSAKRVIKRKKKSINNKDPSLYMKTMLVYMKNVDPHGEKVVKHKTKYGRTTFWVPRVQK